MNGQRYCTRCGSALDPGAGYCRACGVIASAAPPVEIRVARPEPSAAGGGASLKTAAGIGCLFLLLAVAWAFVTTLNVVIKNRTTVSEDLGNRVARKMAGRDAAKVADEYFSLLKKKDYAAAYKMMDGDAKGTLDFETFSGMMDGIGVKLGARLGQELTNAAFRQVYSGGRKSFYYVLTFETKFDKGTAVEEVTLKKIDGILYVHYYDIKSDLLGPGGVSPPSDGGGGHDGPDGGNEVEPLPDKPTLTI